MDKIEFSKISLDIRQALDYFYIREFKKSKIIYEQIFAKINFDFPELYLGYANVLYELDDLNLALDNYKYALKYKVNLYEAYYGLALCYEKLNNMKLAIKNYKSAIDLNKDYLEAYIKLAILFENNNQYDDAKKLYKKGLNFCNKKVLLYDALATFLYRNYKYNKAVKYHKKALQYFTNKTQKEYFYILMNYALTLFKQNKIKQSLKIQKKVVKNLHSVESYINIATMYQTIIKPDISIKYFNKALSIEPKNSDILFGLAISYLYKQDYLKAFSYYESRWLRGELKNVKRDYSQPLFNGNVIKNKKLFIFCEQGYGDNIMFARFLPYIQKYSKAHIIFEASKPLYKLFKYIKGYDTLVSSADNYTDFDYYLPIMSIPYVLKITTKELYTKTPYIFLKNKQQFVFKTKKLKVGLSFSSSKTSDSTYLRQIPLKAFEPLFSLKDIQIYSLEVDNAIIKQVEQYPQIKNLGKQINNFNDTAYAIKELDIIISVDTSIAHLSAALDKPTYLLLSKSYDWRWCCKDGRSIWYPKINIIQQKKLGKWKYVIKKLGNFLV